MILNKTIVSTIFLSLLLLIFPVQSGLAVVLNLDKNSLQKGYTVKTEDEKMFLGIPANSFSEKEKLVAKIFPLDLKLNVWPEKALPISEIYRFYLSDSPENSLNFSIKLTGYSKANKEVYLLDEFSGEWEQINSVIDEKNSVVNFQLNRDRGIVAVFERREDLTASSALVVDKKSGKVIFQKNSKEIRSLASLTKLMTALIFLENKPNWGDRVVLQSSDFVGGATLYLQAGDVVTVKDLFYAMIIGLKNNLAAAWVRSTGLSREDFIKKMNQKAKQLGMVNTSFVDPTGLSEKNVSTAEEMMFLARQVFSLSEVLQASTTRNYEVKVINNNRYSFFENTSNKILDRDLLITATKTGFTNEAGYNLITSAKNKKTELIALVMGADFTKNFEEVYGLLQKYLSN